MKYAFTIHLSSHELWDEGGGEEEINNIFVDIQNTINQWPIKFAFFGREQCPDTGKWHAQGYVEFKARTALSTVKSYEDKRFVGHWESAKATYQQNWDYCTKVDKHPLICGELPKSNKKDGGAQEKKRWKDSYEAAKESRWDDIPADIMIRYVGNLQKISAMHSVKPPNLDDYNFEWIHGEPGSGKSTRARSENPEHFTKSIDKWWCSYQREDVVIIEDIDRESIEKENLMQLLKVWLDKFPFTAQTKGGSLGYIRPKKIVITSNYSIDACFAKIPDKEAIYRRCKVRNFRGTHASGSIKEYNGQGDFVQDIFPAPEPEPPAEPETPAEEEDNVFTPDFRNGPSQDWHYHLGDCLTQEEDEDEPDGISLGTQDTYLV